MKKHILLTTVAVAAALLSSCNIEPDVRIGTGFTLTLDSGSMLTKADEPTFEDAIDHFDFYFFDDVDGTTPTTGMNGRAKGSSVTLQTGVGEDYEALRTGTHYVYVLANYPGDHPQGTLTLEQLLELDVTSKIVKKNKTATNPITGKVEETGEVEFCDNLVMDSYTPATDEEDEKYLVKVTPTQIQQEGNITVGLSRLAAKLSLTINVSQEVDGTMGDVWTPILKDLQAYFVNALNNKTTVGGEPIRRDDLEDESEYEYYSYPTLYPLTKGSSDYQMTLDPVFTYPQYWESTDNGEPYFKIVLPWNSDLRGTSNFYYKVTVPRPESGKWTLNRNYCYMVTVDLSVVDSVNDYVEINGGYSIQPWAGSGVPGGSPLNSAHFFDVPTKEYTLYSTGSVSIPFSSSSAVSAYFTDISFYYYGNTNGTIYHYDFRYTKDDNKTSFTLPTTDSNGRTVANAARESNVYSVEVDGKTVKFNHPLNEVYTERIIKLVIENQEGKKETVTIIQHPAIEVKTHPTKNGFVNGRFARATADVKDGDGNLIGVGPYDTHHFGGGQYYHSSQYWTTEGNNPRIGSTAAEADGLGIIYGDCTTSVSANTMFITEVTVGAFSEGSDSYTIDDRNPKYIIGDPRGSAPSSFSTLPNYLYSDRNHRSGSSATEDVFKAWEKPLEILIASQSTDMNQVVAPKFLVSSNMNNMSNWSLSNAAAVRRAATYQEAGYPAGRWRLPTEAEIAFMMAMQQKGVIAQLYAYGNTRYQCANGTTVSVANGGAITSHGATNGYIRFVYDLWYWGDEPMDPDVYHPNMHEHTNN